MTGKILKAKKRKSESFSLSFSFSNIKERFYLDLKSFFFYLKQKKKNCGCKLPGKILKAKKFAVFHQFNVINMNIHYFT